MTALTHTVKNFLNKITKRYVAPLLNPDGYEFSHTNNRMWRKNRLGKKTKWLFPFYLLINFHFKDDPILD